MVKDLDDLDITLAGEGKDHVPGAEAGVHPTVDRRHADHLREAVCGGVQAIVLGCVGDVVDAHALNRGTP